MKLAGEAGSLLKIEEEIRQVVAAAKKQWFEETTRATDRQGQPLLFSKATMERLAGKPAQAGLFDLGDITNEQFFEEAEARVKEALRAYAEKAQNGHRLQRRLFSDDAVRGFAFVDICQSKYNVVLMNPPFGESIPALRRSLAQVYPASAQDLGMVFVDRGMSVLKETGRLGALTSRTFLANDGMSEWRSVRLLGKTSRLSAFADLGYGVLDEAMVEAAAYVVASAPQVTHLCSTTY